MAARFHFSVIIAQQSADAAAPRRMGGANWSRECAPDDSPHERSDMRD
jgi:hypothetical protein